MGAPNPSGLISMSQPATSCFVAILPILNFLVSENDDIEKKIDNSENIMYLVGGLKILAAIGLLLGLFYKKFIIPCALIIAILMTGAVFMHFKVSDEIHKFFPAALMLVCSAVIIAMSKKATKLKA